MTTEDTTEDSGELVPKIIMYVVLSLSAGVGVFASVWLYTEDIVVSSTPAAIIWIAALLILIYLNESTSE